VDIPLVQACQRGDKLAFQALFERYQQPLFRLAYRFSNNVEDAQDLAQEIFVRLFERIGAYRCESAFSAWLYKVAVNVCLNYRRKPQITESLEALEQEPIDDASNPAVAYEHRELRERLQSAVSKLPENLRSIFVLIEMEGLSYQQTAEILGLTVAAVRMRMSRARGELRKKLRPYMG
jgi:RNA polymerase sigma-70 factor (ECF subfamily)